MWVSWPSHMCNVISDKTLWGVRLGDFAKQTKLCLFLLASSGQMQLTLYAHLHGKFSHAESYGTCALNLVYRAGLTCVTAYRYTMENQAEVRVGGGLPSAKHPAPREWSQGTAREQGGPSSIPQSPAIHFHPYPQSSPTRQTTTDKCRGLGQW